MNLGNIKIEREFIKVNDRVSKTKYSDDEFCYFTRIHAAAGSEVKATLGLVHGFCQTANTTYFESAIMHALNGFEVIMIDQKGFGYSSGFRGANYTIYENHEWIGTMLKQARTDKPLFLVGHSMGCLTIQTFLINNPDLPIAGVIHSAPCFGLPKHIDTSFSRRQMLRGLNEEIVLNTALPIQWLVRHKRFW